MNCPYRIRINSKKIYREFEIAENTKSISLGTTAECEFRLNQKDFLRTIVLTFTFLPSGKRKIRNQIPGSIFSSLTWFIFTKGFGYFITRFWKLSSVYGTLAAFFLTAMWLKFIIMFLFLGASLNRAIQVKVSRECST